MARILTMVVAGWLAGCVLDRGPVDRGAQIPERDAQDGVFFAEPSADALAPMQPRVPSGDPPSGFCCDGAGTGWEDPGFAGAGGWVGSEVDASAPEPVNVTDGGVKDGAEPEDGNVSQDAAPLDAGSEDGSQMQDVEWGTHCDALRPFVCTRASVSQLQEMEQLVQGCSSDVNGALTGSQGTDQFAFCDVPRSYEDARSRCEAAGLYLAIPDTRVQLDQFYHWAGTASLWLGPGQGVAIDGVDARVNTLAHCNFAAAQK